MKKLVGFVLATLVACGALVACGSTAVEKSPTVTYPSHPPGGLPSGGHPTSVLGGPTYQPR
jgi:hypothetical protein